jgi:hypothetical protein
MKPLYFLAAALAAGAISAPAFAETDASIGYSSFDIGSYNLNAVTVRGGWSSADPSAGGVGWGLEAEGAFGVGEDVSGTGAGRSATKLKSEFGAFGTLSAGSDAVSFAARAGYATISARNVSGTGSTAVRSSDSEGGFAYGASASWNMNENNGFRVDYTHYDVDLGHSPAVGSTPPVPGHDANAWTVSYVRRFP